MTPKTAVVLLVAATALASAVAAHAAWQPQKPIEFVATAGPGGGTDNLARAIQGIITKYKLTDQPVVVVNKAGGSGAEGYVYGKVSAGDPSKVIFGTSNAWQQRELLIAVEEEFYARAVSSKIEWTEVLGALVRLPQHWFALLRGAAIGCWMGITPGGPTAASFMSYGIAKRFSRRGARFGTGEVEGIIAPETADHAAGTSALLPMLSLGIPGSATAAVMMGGLMIWGLNPGPMLFVDQKDFVWGLIASMYVGNIVAVTLVLLTVPVFAALLRIPFVIIAPLIVIVCAVGAYSVSNSYLDVVLMLGFGLLGYLFKKLSYPLAPLVLAIVLGDKAEDAFRQSMLMSKGSLGIFFSNNLVTTLVVAGFALFLLPLALQISRMLRLTQEKSRLKSIAR